MKVSLNNVKFTLAAVLMAALGATAGAGSALARDHHEYRDWDHHHGWHHHHDGRAYYTSDRGYYDSGRYYGGEYPAYVPSGAVYQPFEPGISINANIR